MFLFLKDEKFTRTQAKPQRVKWILSKHHINTIRTIIESQPCGDDSKSNKAINSRTNVIQREAPLVSGRNHNTKFHEVDTKWASNYLQFYTINKTLNKRIDRRMISTLGRQMFKWKIIISRLPILGGNVYGWQTYKIRFLDSPQWMQGKPITHQNPEIGFH